MACPRVYRIHLKLTFLWPCHSNPLPASLFLSHNESLGPPYRVLVDTNFINFSLQNKIELVQGMMDCLMAKCELMLKMLLRRCIQST